MRAAVYYGKNDLRVTEVAKPRAGENEVLVKIAYCGVCGTDVHIFHGDGGAAPVPVGTVIGHEFAGTVEAVGAAVKDFAPGDRVAVDPNDWCGACYFCRNGKAHFCENRKGYGTTENGGFAEYVAVPAKQVYHLPDKLTFLTGCQCETLSCCINGVDLCQIKPGQNVLILGAGPIGLMLLQLVRMGGAGKIAVSEPVAEKRELARKFGADVVVDPLTEDLKAVLDREMDNVDCVFEAAGTPRTQAQAIECAGMTATVMLFGLVPPETTIPLSTPSVFSRELKITSSFINPYTFTRALRLLAEGRVTMEGIITDVVPLEGLPALLNDPLSRKRGKAIVHLGE